MLLLQGPLDEVHISVGLYMPRFKWGRYMESGGSPKPAWLHHCMIEGCSHSALFHPIASLSLFVVVWCSDNNNLIFLDSSQSNQLGIWPFVCATITSLELWRGTLDGNTLTLESKTPNELSWIAGARGLDIWTSLFYLLYIYLTFLLSIATHSSSFDSWPNIVYNAHFRHSFIPFKLTIHITHVGVVAFVN